MVKNIIRSSFAVLACQFSCMLPAAAADCDPYQVTVSTTPVIEQSPKRLEIAYDQHDKPDEGPDVVVIGDSLAYNWQQYTKETFPRFSVRNLGVPGERTQELLWRMKNLPMPVRTPAAIVLLIGTNNLSDKATAACGIEAGVVAVTDALAQRWPNAIIFVVPILPRGDGFAFRSQDRAEINADLMSRYKTSKKVAVVQIDEPRITCAASAQPCNMYKPDLVHLQLQGYQFLRQALQQASHRLISTDMFGGIKGAEGQK